MLKGTIPTRGTNEFAIFRLVNTCALIEALKTFRSINFFMSKNIKPYSSCRLLGVFKCPTSEKLFKEGFYSLLTMSDIKSRFCHAAALVAHRGQKDLNTCAPCKYFGGVEDR